MQDVILRIVKLMKNTVNSMEVQLLQKVVEK